MIVVGGVHLRWGARGKPENNPAEKEEGAETVNMQPRAFQEMIFETSIFQYATHIFYCFEIASAFHKTIM